MIAIEKIKIFGQAVSYIDGLLFYMVEVGTCLAKICCRLTDINTMLPFIKVIIDNQSFTTCIKSVMMLARVANPCGYGIGRFLAGDDVNDTGHGFTAIKHGACALYHFNPLNSICRNGRQVILSPPGNGIAVYQYQRTIVNATNIYLV